MMCMDRKKRIRFLNQLTDGKECKTCVYSEGCGIMNKWQVRSKSGLYDVVLISDNGHTYFMCSCSGEANIPTVHCCHISKIVLNIVSDHIEKMEDTYVDNELSTIMDGVRL